MLGNMFILLGIFLILISSIGIIRFPDFYTRLHAAGITDSSGATLLLLGLALHNQFTLNTFKVILLIIIIWVINSTNSYILACTYYKAHNKNV
jgi:multicomponent Na+:H+ antiporter subunit G